MQIADDIIYTYFAAEMIVKMVSVKDSKILISSIKQNISLLK